MFKKLFWLFAVLCAILIIFLPSFTRMQDKKQQNREYRKQIKQLQAKNRQLLKEKRLLEEDPNYLEKIAREKMGIVREGEIIYRVTPLNQDIP